MQRYRRMQRSLVSQLTRTRRANTMMFAYSPAYSWFNWTLLGTNFFRQRWRPTVLVVSLLSGLKGTSLKGLREYMSVDNFRVALVFRNAMWKAQLGNSLEALILLCANGCRRKIRRPRNTGISFQLQLLYFQEKVGSRVNEDTKSILTEHSPSQFISPFNIIHFPMWPNSLRCLCGAGKKSNVLTTSTTATTTDSHVNVLLFCCL